MACSLCIQKAELVRAERAAEAAKAASTAAAADGGALDEGMQQAKAMMEKATTQLNQLAEMTISEEDAAEEVS